MDDMARRRCLMILSVLSGERAVSDVVEEQGISRGTYYNLEQRALEAMLSSLVPTVSAEASSETLAASPQRRIAELEAKVQKLERDKRRNERLLYLTRRIVGSGKVTTAVGRAKKKASKSSSMNRGGTAAKSSTAPKSKRSARRRISAEQASPASGGSTSTPSIPSADGVDVP
jgi:polyhydroxyalkanoate synthesis regulator phasin